jgi:hypothetical protein
MKAETVLSRVIVISLLTVSVVLAPVVGIYFSLADSDILKGNLTFEEFEQNSFGMGMAVNSLQAGILSSLGITCLPLLGCGLLKTSCPFTTTQTTAILRC